MVNRIDSIELAQSYYVLQIADQDVDHITPFVLKQNQAVGQRQRFSQVRFGSQVDLSVPLSAQFVFDTVAEIGDHVKGRHRSNHQGDGKNGTAVSRETT